MKRTVTIHGKEYAPVNVRLEQMRTSKERSDWGIMTDIISITDEQVIIKATICDLAGRPVATGLAFEMRNSSKINKTSYVENCETSAIGRALATLGYGIDASMASAEEVTQAIAQQEEMEKAKADSLKPKQLPPCNDADVEHFIKLMREGIPVAEVGKAVGEHKKQFTFSEGQISQLGYTRKCVEGMKLIPEGLESGDYNICEEFIDVFFMSEEQAIKFASDEGIQGSQVADVLRNLLDKLKKM